MRPTTKTIIFLFALLTGSSIFQYCIKPPDYPNEPVIAFKSQTKNLLRQTGLGTPDSVLITFSFTDGDGDLGSENNELPDIFITDSRDSVTKPPYSIPFIGSQGTGNGISGEVSIALPTTCCIYFPPGSEFPLTCLDVPIAFDTLFYTIYIKDRAGNKSNVIQTEVISLKCR